jgi:hypothetical protein
MLIAAFCIAILWALLSAVGVAAFYESNVEQSEDLSGEDE